MGTFGDRLRREREMRGIGLEEIATATKISTRNLRALEEEKFNQLPGGIFNKGFVRAYAKFLGIDEEHIVAEYELASRDTESAREEKLKADLAKPEPKKSKDDQDISLEPKSQWGTIAAIVLIAVLAYTGYSYYQRKKVDREQQRRQQESQRMAPVAAPVIQPPVSTTPSAEGVQNPTTPAQQTGPATTTASTTGTPNPSPSTTTPAATQAVTPTGGNLSSATNGVTSASQKTSSDSSASTTKPAEQKPAASTTTPKATDAKNFDIKIKVNKASWISITADGKQIVNGTLQPGTEKSVKAADKVEMVLGNAGGVEVSYNGRPVENLSKGQDVRKITFTPSGYE